MLGRSTPYARRSPARCCSRRPRSPRSPHRRRPIRCRRRPSRSATASSAARAPARTPPSTDRNGVAQGFPGWSAPNSNAVLLPPLGERLDPGGALPGISTRFNLACSGGQPPDIAAASSARPAGRTVAAQLDQLRAVAQTHDIDLVLVGLGSNNSSVHLRRRRGRVRQPVHRRRLDRLVGVLGLLRQLGHRCRAQRAPCTDADLATAAAAVAPPAPRPPPRCARCSTCSTRSTPTASTRSCFQDYTNPLPPTLAEQYRTEDGRDDNRDKFRALGAERYAAGCPVDRACLAPAHRFCQNLGGLVAGVASTAEGGAPVGRRPHLPQRAARLRRRPALRDRPAARAARWPPRCGVHGRPDRRPRHQLLAATTSSPSSAITNTCESYFQTCQESWHPNAAGHQVLGQLPLRRGRTGGARRHLRATSTGGLLVQ